MFTPGVLPALLWLFIRRQVPESPVWTHLRSQQRRPIAALLRSHGKLFLYAVVLMTAFNFFSHGTQDLFPTYLQAQRKLSTHTVSIIIIIANIGAIIGGAVCGIMSQHLGRRR